MYVCECVIYICNIHVLLFPSIMGYGFLNIGNKFYFLLITLIVKAIIISRVLRSWTKYRIRAFSSHCTVIWTQVFAQAQLPPLWLSHCTFSPFSPVLWGLTESPGLIWTCCSPSFVCAGGEITGPCQQGWFGFLIPFLSSYRRTFCSSRTLRASMGVAVLLMWEKHLLCVFLQNEVVSETAQ